MEIKNILLVLCLFTCMLMLSCKDTVDVTVAEFEDWTKGDEIPATSLKHESIDPLRNPDRGFHFEIKYKVSEESLDKFFDIFSEQYYPRGFISDSDNKYQTIKDSVVLAQQYLYLGPWYNKDISQGVFDNMQLLFDEYKKNGYKVILRFVYKGSDSSTDPDFNDVKDLATLQGHFQQLKPFIRKNIGQIATIQCGFIGTWGEWHTSIISGNQTVRNAVVNGILDMLPQEYYGEIRLPEYKNKITFTNQADKARLGFHNDYFTAGEHPKASGSDLVPGSAGYTQALTESPYFYMSGEMPYNENSDWGLGFKISLQKTLEILRDHHYSAFNVTHNADLNIPSWKREFVYPTLLDGWKIVYSPDYFKNKEGKTVSRSFYEFVRDHLGYRLNLLEETTITAVAGTVDCKIQLSNTGFATVINPKEVYLVLIDESGNIVKKEKQSVDPKNWQPYQSTDYTYQVLTHKIDGKITGVAAGKYKVGIWMPDAQSNIQEQNAAYDVKWAVNSNLSHQLFNNGKMAVNIIGEVTL